MFDWSRFLELAETLRASGDEAALRTAISRSYYAAYHTATLVVRSRSILVPRHHRIWGQLETAGEVRGRADLVEIGGRGRDLKRWRERADYHSPFNSDNRRQAPIHVVTRDVLAATRELLDLLNAL